jgi:hypothetical protein
MPVPFSFRFSNITKKKAILQFFTTFAEQTMNLFQKIKTWYSAQTDTTKALLWIGLVAVIGILIRWDAVVEGIKHGFSFYSSK